MASGPAAMIRTAIALLRYSARRAYRVEWRRPKLQERSGARYTQLVKADRRALVRHRRLGITHSALDGLSTPRCQASFAIRSHQRGSELVRVEGHTKIFVAPIVYFCGPKLDVGMSR